MQNLKMVIRYDGTRYSGWQKQGNTENTIQGKLESAISRIAGQAVEVHGSGRTDAGVHAMGQVANVKLKTAVDPAEFRRKLNDLLSEDIAVTEICEVPERFHARLSAVRKTYQYRLYIGDAKPVFDRRQVTVLEPLPSLNIEAMRRAAEYLRGIHDFTSFCGNPSFKKSAVRRIDSLEIIEEADELVIRVTGDGFLQNMVRIITGTLIEVGKGAMRPEEIRDILAAKNRKNAGPTAPAKGLMLVGVEYTPS
ncbi:MAG: tRNA pseudouridine(38-40) synthase TruA [Lachnospiraceae bacterium]|nr:tRNA pseudouridine(38-40) synthase TruA [Lachnospiraceae bacterium]